MQPQRPVYGPAGEGGFVFPLFESSNSLQIIRLEIELVGNDEKMPPPPDKAATDDTDCTCE